MELNKTCCDMLLFLLQQNDYIPLNVFTQKYNLSERAVRYNISKIESFLLSNGFSYLDKMHKKGIRLIGTKELDAFMDSFLQKDTPYKYVFSAEERFAYIALYLLKISGPVDADIFERNLCVSKNTILKELEKIQTWMADRDLLLEKIPRKGLVVEGSEAAKWKAFREILFQTVSSQDILKFIKKKAANSKIKDLQLKLLFQGIDVTQLDDFIKTAEFYLDNEFSDESYAELLGYLVTVIRRILGNTDYTLPVKNLDSTVQSEEYKASLMIISSLERLYGVKVNPAEVEYLSMQLSGATRLRNRTHDGAQKEIVTDLYGICEDMVREIEKIYDVNFDNYRREIVEGLIVHIRSAIFRLTYGMPIINPLYGEIVSKYQDLMTNTRSVIQKLEKLMEVRIDDQEISYIALHFGSALFKINKNFTSAARVLIVCGSGIGTARMVACQVEELFDIEIVDVVSSRAVLNILKIQHVDYVISTVAIPEINDDQYVRINPIISKEDHQKLSQHLQQRYQLKNNSNVEIEMTNKLIDIVEKYCVVTDRYQLQYEFINELINFKKTNIEKKKEIMLNDLITRSFIKLNVPCENWVDAINSGASVLEENGCVKPCYKEAIINSLKEYGSYMVIRRGVVLSHAKPEDGVNKVAISLITLKNPVRFSDRRNEPVKLIITLAAVDKEKHMKALKQLLEILNNEDNLKTIMRTSSKEEILDMIKTNSAPNLF